MTNNYYLKQKQKFQKEARERYQDLSEEEKEKRGKKARERFYRKFYQNFTEEEEQKQKLAEYRRNFYLTRNK